MIGLVDYHMHSILSDGYNTYEEMILVAIEKGLIEIGFTDHVCLKPTDWAMQLVDIPVMAEQINDLKKKYGAIINIRTGLEVDYIPGMEAEIKAIIESVPLDFVIGSVHFIDDWNFDTNKDLYGKWTNDNLYKQYFKLVQMATASDLFDIIGHIDIIKKFNIYPESNQYMLFDETIQLIKKHNLVVELNTGGLDRPCAEFTPSPEILKICYQHGVQVTLSSDAHRANQIARHYQTAIDLLKLTGYHEIVGFQNRTRKMIRI
jgi:histidinol-phosphatase (PHP family)